MEYLIIFDNSNLVLEAEELLKDKDVRTVPTPSAISSTCGLALKIKSDDINGILLLLSEYKGLYLIEGELFNRKYKEIDNGKC